MYHRLSMQLGLWRCSFHAGGTTHAGVLVDTGTCEPLSLLVGDHLYSREELNRHYPGASKLDIFADLLAVPVSVTEDEWRVSTESEKSALIYRELDVHEVRS